MRFRELVAVILIALASSAATGYVLHRAGGGPAAPSAPPPALDLGTGGALKVEGGLTRDLGTVAAGVARTAVWTLRNIATTPLKFRPTGFCDCTATNVKKGEMYTVVPGGTFDLDATYRPSPGRTVQTPAIDLVTSDPTNRVVRLTARLTVTGEAAAGAAARPRTP